MSIDNTDKKETYSRLITAARTELLEVITALDETQRHTPVLSEGDRWTPLDILAHLAENERGMSIHIHKIRNGKETVPEDFDLEQWNAGLKERAGSPSLEELLQTLAETRAKTLEVLNSLDEDEWALTGRHPFRGEITIEEYYHTIAGHDRFHLDDVKQGLGLAG